MNDPLVNYMILVISEADHKLVKHVISLYYYIFLVKHIMILLLWCVIAIVDVILKFAWYIHHHELWCLMPQNFMSIVWFLIFLGSHYESYCITNFILVYATAQSWIMKIIPRAQRVSLIILIILIITRSEFYNLSNLTSKANWITAIIPLKAVVSTYYRPCNW